MQRASIIGSGPNGLAAAIRLAQTGLPVTVYERAATAGGACTTGEMTLPGFHHDLGASVFPVGFASPFFRSLPLDRFGLEWIQPPAAVAHPLDDGSAVMLESSLAAMLDHLEQADRAAWRMVMAPLARRWPDLSAETLAPPLHWPRNPLLMAGFGALALLPATVLARALFRGSRARALFAGSAAHSVLPLSAPFSAAVGLVLSAAGHAAPPAGGWPIPRGGAQAITDALVGYLESLGGRFVLNHTVTSLKELAPSRDHAVLCDLTPRQLLALGETMLPTGYRAALGRFRYGPGAYKVDWALAGPIPWRDANCLRAATVHVGGTLEEIAASEADAWQGRVSARPFVLVAQPSLFDPTRAPAGQHTAWGYCHVPHGLAETEPGGSRLEAIESQIERFAPGFRDLILARRAMGCAALEQWNPNLVGGDVAGGAMNARQLLLRPTRSLYRTPVAGLYLASASTPPGGGVHGMCGFHAAEAALADLRRSPGR